MHIIGMPEREALLCAILCIATFSRYYKPGLALLRRSVTGA